MIRIIKTILLFVQAPVFVFLLSLVRAPVVFVIAVPALLFLFVQTLYGPFLFSQFLRVPFVHVLLFPYVEHLKFIIINKMISDCENNILKY